MDLGLDESRPFWCSMLLSKTVAAATSFVATWLQRPCDGWFNLRFPVSTLGCVVRIDLPVSCPLCNFANPSVLRGLTLNHFEPSFSILLKIALAVA